MSGEGDAGGEKGPKVPKAKRLRALLPDLAALVKPRRKMLAAGFVLMAVGRAAGLVLPASTKVLIDDVVGKARTELLVPLLAAVGAATLVQAATSFTLTQVLSKGAQRLIAELRTKLQAHVARLPVAYFDGQKTGNLVSRVMNDVEGIRNLVGTGIVEMAGGLVTATLALAVMATLSPLLTGLTLLFLSLFGIGLFAAFGVLRPVFRERSKIYGEVSGRLTETFAGIRVVKGYHGEKREEAVFAEGVSRILANVLKTITGMSSLSVASTVLLGGVGVVVMWFGTRQILAGSLTVGGLFTYTVLLGFLVAPVFQVVGIGTQLTEALAGLERTKEIFSETPEDVDPRRTFDLPDVRGEVVFEDVRFAYAEGKEVLHGVSFRAAPGTVTALVGPSGSGKSTIIGLVAAFQSPSSGRVLVDGVDLSTVRIPSFRSRLGVVLQESFLFDGTIRENVAFSRPSATEAEVVAACRVARVDEFAEGFEKGYETVVGERGVKLSGGQRQRVSIARALLADPRILILDEATSSLDTESEAFIQQGLSELLKGRTTFVIAHRLSTIRRADQILVVERGVVVEQGRHEELMAAGGRYAEMVARQAGIGVELFGDPREQEPGGSGSPGPDRGERLGPLSLLAPSGR
ncbi:MAG: ABC transporter ATP-binding protein/permease [Thermoanaerobaculia bacterium]|nr:ABC transporter ATP-binding protein/permease [Thermoanaerobaculia bacterium]